MATKVNLQEIALQDHLISSMSTFYGLASEKPSHLEPFSSSTLRSNSNANHSVFIADKKFEKS